MKTKQKIVGILFMLLLLSALGYISLFRSAEIKNKVEIINIEGNEYLTREQYLDYARLNKVSDYKLLSLAVIKDRLEKHPFVDNADVKFKNKNEVLVILKEKKFEAIVLSGSEEYLISERFEIIPVSLFKSMDLPVIVNPQLIKKIKKFAVLKTDDLISAFKMIETAKLINKDLYSGLAEINMRDGKDIVLTFSGFEFPVVIGRGNEVNKMLYFNEVWKKLNHLQISDLPIEYVDLRFDKLINIGLKDSLAGSGGI